MLNWIKKRVITPEKAASRFVARQLSEQRYIDEWGNDPENYYYHLTEICYSGGREYAGRGPLTDELLYNLTISIKYNQFMASIDECWDGTVDASQPEIKNALCEIFMAGLSEEPGRIDEH